MTDHELQILFIGATLGAQLMLLAQIITGILTDRREAKQETRALQRLKAANDWREAVASKDAA